MPRWKPTIEQGRAYQKKYRESHRDQIRAREAGRKRTSASSERATAKRHAMQAAVNDIKLGRGCERCGFNAHPIALHFDHIDPASKSMDVCKMITSNRTMDEILAEIQKCRVLCANCHAIKTIEDGDYLKYRDRIRAERGLPPKSQIDPQRNLFGG